MDETGAPVNLSSISHPSGKASVPKRPVNLEPLQTRDSESFGGFGKGTVAKCGISERTPCLGFERETLVERHLTCENRRKLCDCRAI